MPSFNHEFDPPAQNPIGASALLSIQEIEDAGLLEVIQSPGARLGTWNVLGGLLTASSAFQFINELGHSREVKTALSGLFGRFVARAYLEKYFQYSFFDHIRKPPMVINRLANATVVRTQGLRGDLPDWVTWGPTAATSLAIAEAKGCHDKAGPAQALDRAWTQAHRVEIVIAGRRAPLKRFAIATRWGVQNSASIPNSIISVRDPDEPGDSVSEEEVRNIGLGIAQRHCATLFDGLGYKEFSTALRQTINPGRFGPRPAVAAAQSERINSTLSILETLRGARIHGDLDLVSPEDDLIGGFITPAGVVMSAVPITASLQRTLDSIGIVTMFVGMERRLLEYIVKGDVEAITTLIEHKLPVTSEIEKRSVRANRSGAWIIRTGADVEVQIIE